MAGKIRVYIATSLDGFIAGPGDDLSWLGTPTNEALVDGAVGFEAFMAEVGAMLMGRRTYDVVRRMGPWFYGDTPVLVPTHRPLDDGAPDSVRAVSGDIHALLDEALRVAGGKDVYVDGGATVRAALESGRVDDLIVTLVPTVLGEGIPLFAGLRSRQPMEILSHHDYPGGMVQMRMRPAAAG